jgi:hypothetical protein
MSHVAIHAAAERKKKEKEEEENMSRYSQQELEEDWEFKIVRSATGAFKQPEVLRSLIEEEALAGWKMVEKFDDNRIRFKRPASAQRKDEMLPPQVDPYRTQFGMSEAGLAFRILFAIGVITGLIILVVSIFGS